MHRCFDDIAEHGQMRKQVKLLEYHADLPAHGAKIAHRAAITRAGFQRLLSDADLARIERI